MRVFCKAVLMIFLIVSSEAICIDSTIALESNLPPQLHGFASDPATRSRLLAEADVAEEHEFSSLLQVKAEVIEPVTFMLTVVAIVSLGVMIGKMINKWAGAEVKRQSFVSKLRAIANDLNCESVTGLYRASGILSSNAVLVERSAEVLFGKAPARCVLVESLSFTLESNLPPQLHGFASDPATRSRLLAEADVAEEHEFSSLLQVKAEVIEPVTFMLTVVAIVSLGVMIGKMINKWAGAEVKRQSFVSKLRAIANDLNCESVTGLYRASGILSSNAVLVERTAEVLFGKAPARCKGAAQAECVETCARRITKATTEVAKAEALKSYMRSTASSRAKSKQSSFVELATRGGGGKDAKSKGKGKGKGKVTLGQSTSKPSGGEHSSDAVPPEREDEPKEELQQDIAFDTSKVQGLSTAEATKTCQTLLETANSVSTQVRELRSKVREQAITTCGGKTAGGKPGACLGEDKYKHPTQRYACSMARAHVQFFDDVDATTNEALNFEPASISYNGGVTGDNQLDFGAELKDVYVMDEATRSEASEVFSGLQGGGKEFDQAMTNLPDVVTNVGQFAVMVIDTIVSLAQRYFNNRNMKSELTETLADACGLRHSIGITMGQIQMLQRTQEDAHRDMSGLMRSVDWSPGAVNALRFLYAEYFGDEVFRTQVADERWRKHKCEALYKRHGGATQGAAAQTKFVNKICPKLLDTVATLVVDDMSAFDVWHVLYDSVGKDESRMERYQRALFRVQRRKLSRAAASATEELQSLGCPPFDVLQLEFERERLFVESHAGDAAASDHTAQIRALTEQAAAARQEPAKEMCKVQDLAYCAAAMHYSRCYHEPLEVNAHDYNVGEVLQRFYQAFRSMVPWSTVLPTLSGTDTTRDNDPFYPKLEKDAAEIENLLLGGAKGDWKKKKKRKELASSMPDGKFKFKTHIAEVLVDDCAWRIRQLRDCEHAPKLAEFLASPTGSFRNELLFGELRWLAAAFYAPEETRYWTRSSGKDDKLNWTPLGCLNPIKT